MKKTKDEAESTVTLDGSKVTTKPYKPKKSWKLKLGLGLLVFTLLVSGGVAYYFLNASKDEAVTPDAGVATKIERIAGADRYATAALISQKQYPSGTSTAIVATGASIVDALPSVALAKKANAPILLTAKDSLPSATLTELRRLKVTKIYIIGGTAAVSAKPEATLRTVTTNIKRVAGPNRRDTSIALAREAYTIGGNKITDSTAIVVGQMANVDAATAANLAALRGWPIIYSANNDGATIGATLRSIGVSKTFVVAPTATVSDATMRNFPGYERMAGADRYATMALVAKKAESFGLKYETIGVIKPDGQTLDDIAMTSYVGSKNGFTVLGVSSAQTVAIFTKAKATAKNVYIAGGTGAIDKYAEYDIKYAMGMITMPAYEKETTFWKITNVKIYNDKITFTPVLKPNTGREWGLIKSKVAVKDGSPGSIIAVHLGEGKVKITMDDINVKPELLENARIQGLSVSKPTVGNHSYQVYGVVEVKANAEFEILKSARIPITVSVTGLVPGQKHEINIAGSHYFTFTTLK